MFLRGNKDCHSIPRKASLVLRIASDLLVSLRCLYWRPDRTPLSFPLPPFRLPPPSPTPPLPLYGTMLTIAKATAIGTALEVLLYGEQYMHTSVAVLD